MNLMMIIKNEEDFLNKLNDCLYSDYTINFNLKDIFEEPSYIKEVIMKTGVFGGTFNPVHKGHIMLAEYCMDSVGLDRIIMIPTLFRRTK